jgi:hypothetical protein
MTFTIKTKLSSDRNRHRNNLTTSQPHNRNNHTINNMADQTTIASVAVTASNYMIKLCYKGKYLQYTFQHLSNLHQHVLFGDTKPFVCHIMNALKKVVLAVQHLGRLWYRFNIRFDGVLPFYNAVSAVCFDLHGIVAAMQNIDVVQQKPCFVIQDQLPALLQRFLKRIADTVPCFEFITKQVPRDVHCQVYKAFSPSTTTTTGTTGADVPPDPPIPAAALPAVQPAAALPAVQPAAAPFQEPQLPLQPQEQQATFKLLKRCMEEEEEQQRCTKQRIC